MDRIAPTRRPSGPAIGYQRWRDLLFLHWPVPVERVRRCVPSSLELDLLDGVAYVGVVPFAMEGVRPRFVPEAASMQFLETNLRTYVHLGGENPGVYFFSLDAASRLAVYAARVGFGLAYHHAALWMTGNGGAIEYGLARGDHPRFSVRYRPGAPLGPSEPGTPEFFLLERYLLYTERAGRPWRGQVHHAPYLAQTAEVLEVHDELFGAAGLPPADGPPAFVHYAAGVDVEIFTPRPVRRDPVRAAHT